MIKQKNKCHFKLVRVNSWAVCWQHAARVMSAFDSHVCCTVSSWLCVGDSWEHSESSALSTPAGVQSTNIFSRHLGLEQASWFRPRSCPFLSSPSLFFFMIPFQVLPTSFISFSVLLHDSLPGLAHFFHLLLCSYRLVGLVVKASASRAEDPGFESRLRQDFFGVESYQWLKNWHSSGYPARRLAW